MKRRNAWLAGVLLTLAVSVNCGTDPIGPAASGDGNCTVNPVSGECETDNPDLKSDSTGTNSDTNSDSAESRDPWADDDGDGFIDRFDNCPDAANPDQADGDGDGVGDACDNCLEASNFDQEDADGNGIGDACEGDSFYDPNRDDDDDGVPDNMDNCGGVANPDQADADMDGIGDACDNCPNAANYDQADEDMNGVGDACELVPAGMICGEQESMFTIVEPNIYILLDRSGSMGSDGISQATAALDNVADQLFADVRFGFGTFQTGSCPGLEHQLDMGSHAANTLKASWAGLAPGGTTPTAGALNAVRTQNRLSDPTDPIDAQRAKAVVLVTDGNPNTCTEGLGIPDASVAAAAALAADGVPVYVVAFKFGGSETTLDLIAQAGGTDAPPVGGDLFYTANDTNALAMSLGEIAASAIACSYTIDPPAPDANKVWVELDGMALPRAAYTYDEATNTLTLDQATCDQLRTIDPMGMNPPLKITIGCATECEPGPEVCDYMDNDCDGEIDEGCEGCEPEICDGIDNDCDDVVDEGCPDCVLDGESCEMDSDCCHGNCREDLGICGPPCRPLNTSCRSDDDCCSGTCAKQGGAEVGVCIGG